MRRPWLLAERTYADIKSSPPEVAVIPFGATEPHNLHLPYSTDVIEADVIGATACEKAWARGAKAICLATIPYGTETNQQHFPFAMNLMPSTLLAIIRDLTASLENSGVRKCLLLNSHGGNDFKAALRELHGSTSVHLFLSNWYTIGQDVYHDVFVNKDDHAGEMETSFILHVRPELVELNRADEGAVSAFRFEALRRGWVQVTRPWHLLTTNSGAGDPRQATAEKGRRWIDHVTDKLADFLVELAASPLDDRFPFA